MRRQRRRRGGCDVDGSASAAQRSEAHRTACRMEWSRGGWSREKRSAVDPCDRNPCRAQRNASHRLAITSRRTGAARPARSRRSHHARESPCGGHGHRLTEPVARLECWLHCARWRPPHSPPACIEAWSAQWMEASANASASTSACGVSRRWCRLCLLSLRSHPCGVESRWSTQVCARPSIRRSSALGHRLHACAGAPCDAAGLFVAPTVGTPGSKMNQTHKRNQTFNTM